MFAEREIQEILKHHKAELVRSRKHLVWLLPNGRRFIRSSTPSDCNTSTIELGQLRRLLNLHSPSRGLVGERRPRRVRVHRARSTRFSTSCASMVRRTTFRDQLKVVTAPEEVKA